MSDFREVTEGLPRPTLPRRKVRCSFCEKREDSVQKLIAGPDGIQICDECIGLCNEIIEEESKERDLSV